MKKQNYFVGLDVGTNSVGYAVTTEDYTLCKYRGEPMWGVTLFDEASSAEKRRNARLARRRLDRRQQRVKLVQELFAREIGKVDKDFFRRIKESYLFPESTEEKIRLFGTYEEQAQYAKAYHNSHDCARKVKAQIAWSDDRKATVWADIVAEKIRKQAEHLDERDKKSESALLRSYLWQIEPHDATNREGHVAKVYFNALFGMNFTRSEENITNASLNYGYSILLSAFNREITAHGYLTQIGIFHDNMFNPFNLSCDLMEPFRILVDRKVMEMNLAIDFTTEHKHTLLGVLNDIVVINQTKQTVLNAIKYYCRSVFDALNEGDASLIQFYSL